MESRAARFRSTPRRTAQFERGRAPGGTRVAVLSRIRAYGSTRLPGESIFVQGGLGVKVDDRQPDDRNAWGCSFCTVLDASADVIAVFTPILIHVHRSRRPHRHLPTPNPSRSPNKCKVDVFIQRKIPRRNPCILHHMRTDTNRFPGVSEQGGLASGCLMSKVGK